MPSPKKSGTAASHGSTLDTMTFGDAMTCVLNGQDVRRLEWPDTTVVLTMREERLSIRKADGTVSDLIVSAGDIAGTDWIVVDLRSVN